MPILSKFLATRTTLLCLGLTGLTRTATGAPDAHTVAEAEKNFASAALSHGIRESFLQFFAEDSIIFAPAPTDGKTFYTKYTDKGRRLIWQPIFATISQGGDLGVTTGPWELKQSATDETSLAFGEFLSIWKKQADGSWKVKVDVGVDHAKPDQPAPELQILPAGDAPKHTPDGKVGLAKTQKTFDERLKINAGRAVLEAGSDDIRCLRQNSFPAVGKNAAKTLLDSESIKQTRQQTGAGRSDSNDFAYQYGSYTNARESEGEKTGHYLTIWRMENAGDWKILIDLQKQADAK